MYLHRPIPDITTKITSPEFVVDVIKVGRREGYAKLVYGNPEAPCSWDDIQAGDHPAWNLQAAYNELWERYWANIVDIHVQPDDMPEILTMYDVVFSTIPAKALCQNPAHIFKSQDIWVIHGHAESFHATLGSMMYYNGYPPDSSVGGIMGPDWYRFSQICGYQAWEYSFEQNKYHHLKSQKLSRGTKPLDNNCDCFPEVQRLGRFGKWKKGVLTHHAFEEAEDRMVRVVELV
jgi:hypothetical protein